MTVRRNRGLRISDAHASKLRHLSEALALHQYLILEQAIDHMYNQHLEHPRTGPILRKLAEVQEVKRACAQYSSSDSANDA